MGSHHPHLKRPSFYCLIHFYKRGKEKEAEGEAF